MRSLDNQIEYWNSVSSSKSFTHPIDIGRFHSFVSLKANILDYGCGYGRTCDELYRFGFRNIVGVDSSQMMIERGHKEYPHLNLKTLKNNNIPYDPDAFDAIVLFAVLTCIPTNEGQQALISEIYRTLRPDGIVYISDYWLQGNERNINRYDRFKEKYGLYGVFELPEGTIVRHHDKDWILSLLKDFNTIELFDFEVTTMNGNTSLGFQYFGRKMENL
jgi:SAM-dependent methyltransferase